jgi:hypothetical protein
MTEQETLDAVTAKLTGEGFYPGQRIQITYGGSKGRHGAVSFVGSNRGEDSSEVWVRLEGEKEDWLFPKDWVKLA